MILYHYYHIYADGNWRHIVSNHFDALFKSGLIGNFRMINVGIVGSCENRMAVKAVLDSILSGLPWAVCAEADFGWEQETQDPLYEHAVKSADQFYVLYAHTKGAFAQTEFNRIWREVMTRFTILEWKEALRNFTYNIGAVGCLWLDDLQIFAGTFWWATSNAIAAIGRPARNTRYDAEIWIGLIRRATPPFEIRCLFNAPLSISGLMKYAIKQEQPKCVCHEMRCAQDYSTARIRPPIRRHR